MPYYVRYLNVYRAKTQRITLSVIFDTIHSGGLNSFGDDESIPADLLEQIQFGKVPTMYDDGEFRISTLPAGSDYYQWDPNSEENVEEDRLQYRFRLFSNSSAVLPGDLFKKNADGSFKPFVNGNARNLYTPDGNYGGSSPETVRYWNSASNNYDNGYGSWWKTSTSWGYFEQVYLFAREMTLLYDAVNDIRTYRIVGISKSGTVWRIVRAYGTFTSKGHYKWEESDNAPFSPMEDTPYGNDPSGPAGGDGNHDMGTSDNIAGDIPNGTVEANSSAVGLFTRYAMNVGQMQALAEKIYADNFLEKLGLEVTKFLWNSPIDAIISCQSYPFAVTSLVGSSEVNDIKLGAVPTGLRGSALAGSAAKIDWGSIRLEEYWKNFLDYAPHTKIELYLPWSTGFVEIDPHECLPGSIGVVTNIEFGKGTCQHIVTGNKGAVIGVFSGVCATTLPLTSIDTASKAVNVVTAAAGLAVAAVTTGVAGAAATGVATGVKAFGAGLTMSSAIKAGAGEFARSLIPPSNYTPIANSSSGIAARSSIAAFRQPPHVVRNGSFNGNGAGMGIQYPFIILSRPTQNVPKNYGHYYGYPSNIYTTLGSVSGYTEVASVHLDGISCTVQERDEIDNLLKGGVIL